MTVIICLLFGSLLVHADARPKEVWCPQNEQVCHFTLVVDYGLTMMHGNVLVKPFNGYIYRFDAIDLSHEPSIPLDDVITADGHHEPRLVMTYNGSIPGPALHVHKGQQVRLTLKNNMMHETTTLHMHGQHQAGTQFSDGVPFVTQCPVLPGQMFVYNFIAEPSGTFFYHSHSGPQQSNGLYGPFIVHHSSKHRKRNTGTTSQSYDDYTSHDTDVYTQQSNYVSTSHSTDDGSTSRSTDDVREHILVFQDWNHDWDSNMLTMKMRHGLYKEGQKIPVSHSLANISYSAFLFHSGLINGRGRYYDNHNNHNGAPLSEFTVVHGYHYRLRLINAADLHPFRVSIDSHSLLVVNSDGFDIEPIVVESVIIHPGERYDVIIEANQTVGNYWIRGHTLQREYNNTAEAILRYAGAPIQDAMSSPKTCTEDDLCVVLNCSFSFYPAGSNTVCHNYGDINSATCIPLQTKPGKEIEEVFLNFAFPGRTDTPGSVNGKSFVGQDFTLLSKSRTLWKTCSRDNCGSEDDICYCPYTVSIDDGDLVQFVFLNLGSGQGWDHPVHLHGHSFQVVEVGYPTYNKETGEFIKGNKDVHCDDVFCNKAKWAITSWAGGNIPGINLDRAPTKDNVIVPSGAYVVVRFKADNPGLWIIHCHLGLHMTDGMAALVNESYHLWPRPPPDFPTCHNYYGYLHHHRLHV